MPKTRSLIQRQKDEEKVSKISTTLMDILLSQFGLSKKEKKDFVKQLDISTGTWYNWEQNGIETARLKKILLALLRSGADIKIDKPTKTSITITIS